MGNQTFRVWDYLPYPARKEMNAHTIVRGVMRNHSHHTGVLRQLGMASTEFQDGRPTPSAVMHSPMAAYHMSHLYREWLPLELWNRWRQVYVPHPLVTEELAGTGSDKVSGTLLRQLRHINPMFVFPFGIPVLHSNGQKGNIRAFTVSGGHALRYGTPAERFHPSARRELERSARLMGFTNDPDINCLSVQVASEVEDEAGMVVDVNWGNFTLPILDQFSLDSLTDLVAKDFTSDVDTEHLQDYVRTCLRSVVAHLLCSVASNIEIGEAQQPAKGKKKKNSGREKPVAYHPLGYRLGAALGAWRERKERGVPGAPTGVTLAPHLRQGHLHTYKVGPGRREEIVKFLAPIPVNATMEGLGDDALPVFHQYI